MNGVQTQPKAKGTAGAYNAKAYGAASATAALAGLDISRRAPTGRDVQIDILY